MTDKRAHRQDVSRSRHSISRRLALSHGEHLPLRRVLLAIGEHSGVQLLEVDAERSRLIMVVHSEVGEDIVGGGATTRYNIEHSSIKSRWQACHVPLRPARKVVCAGFRQPALLAPAIDVGVDDLRELNRRGEGHERVECAVLRVRKSELFNRASQGRAYSVPAVEDVQRDG